MSLSQPEINLLQRFLPEGTVPPIIQYLNEHKIHLHISRERKSKYGDFRPGIWGRQHRISVNGNLNKYHFLITLLHEIAHLLTFIQFGAHKQPHGNEWKNEFKKLLIRFHSEQIFPVDILNALIAYIHNPSATSCTDIHLFGVLRKYDKENGSVLVSSLTIGDIFKTKDNLQYQILEKKRTRWVCIQLSTGKKYLFPGIHEVFIEL